MARKAQSSPATPDAVMTGPDGVPMQSVNVARSRPFARACLDAWQEREVREGRPVKNRAHWMGFASFWVPVEIIDLARAKLEAAAEEAEHGL